MAEQIFGQCWSCTSFDGDRDSSCEHCGGAGVVPVTAEDAMHRRKLFLGRKHPLADANGNEKWARFAAEVPPELAQALDRVQRRIAGIHRESCTRSGLVRFALLEWLEKYDGAPVIEPESVEGDAEEMPEELSAGG